MTEPDDVYRVFQYGDEIPVGLQARAEGQQVMIRDSIRYLVTRELQDHLGVEHKCEPGCYSAAVANVIMEQMPHDQARFVAMELVQLLAKAFLRDNPGALVDALFGGTEEGA